MPKRTTRSAAEQKLLDQVAVGRYLDCLRTVNPQSREGCAQLAIEDAEIFISERRKRLAKH